MVVLENYTSHYHSWKKCFNDPQMSDVVFQAQDGQTFYCERFVLEVTSPYFKKLFASGKWLGSKKIIPATELDPSALKAVLRSFYTGDVDVDDDSVVGILTAATSFEVEWLKKACLKYLKKDNAGPVVTFEYSKTNEKWVEWKVPKSGWYHIVAMGAKAADAPVDSYLFQAKGGEGAIVGASFEFQADDVLQILTGGMSRIWPKSKAPGWCGGGGGGTFVALKRKKPSLLIVAGGGGGVHTKYYGCDASLSESGSTSHSSYPGGKNGGNGAGKGVYTGGLGWNAGPAALAKPRTTSTDDTGGFGGGGNCLGGGGGYSGGGCGYYYGGGGGGSYIGYEASSFWKKVGNATHGKVYIWSGKAIPVQETFFIQQIGDINAQANTESIDTWEILH